MRFLGGKWQKKNNGVLGWVSVCDPHPSSPHCASSMGTPIRKIRDEWGTRALVPVRWRTGKKRNAGVLRSAQNDKQKESQRRRTGALVSFAEGDFEGVYGFSVADAFELAIELSGWVVRVAVFFFVGGFGLALLEGVV
jgi:hypothetical protein